ncbi:MAG: hypothetical protein D6698_11905 [Gammaproteobacteria bacterium]|nr:MAG: hypothetical protein D6698_11905 [Gammaproteobacteria bacterium]
MIRSHYHCPNCKRASITLREKHSTGLWKIITCPHCHRRLTALPLLLGLFAGLHVWNIAWFTLWSYYKANPLWLLMIPVVWLILDILTLRFVPLATLKRNN